MVTSISGVFPMSYLDDPRVYFAAERTLLAWQRTAIALMGFGFVIERFGLFIKLMAHGNALPDTQSTLSLFIGVGFILTGAVTALLAAIQFIIFCKTLSDQEKPRGYLFWLPPAVNVFVSLSATALSAWLILSR